MFKKNAALLGLLLFPVLLCLNVWQSYRFQQVQDQLQTLQEKQVELLEKNKRALAALAVYSSPARVGALAEEDLALRKAGSEDIVHIKRADP